MRKLRVALLGQGRSGRSIHGEHLLRDTEKFEVACVCDLLPDRREKARALWGCDTTDDSRTIFAREDIDLVVNALPSPLHAPVTREFLRRGFNVLTEKPMAETPEQADEMIASATKSRLFVFQQSRFAPYYVKAKEIMQSGLLGRIVSVNIAFSGFARRWDWQCLQENVAGSLYNTGPHPLDQALDILGFEKDVQIAYCRMDRALTFGDAEDYVKLLLTAPDAPLVDIEISSCNAYPAGTYNVQGTRGGLWGTTEELKWRYFEPSEAPAQRLIREPLTSPEGEPAYCSEKLPFHTGEWRAAAGENAFELAVARYYGEVYDALVSGAPTTVTPAQVRKQIAIIRKCHEMCPLSRFEGGKNA